MTPLLVLGVVLAESEVCQSLLEALADGRPCHLRRSRGRDPVGGPLQYVLD